MIFDAMLSLGDVRRYVKSLGVNFLNRWFMVFVFRFMLIKRAYSVDEIRREFAGTITRE